MKLKLLIQHKWHSGKRGGQTILLEATTLAFERFKITSQYQNPGFLHCYLTHSVKEAMTARGYRIWVEKSIKGKRIDVVLESDQETIAVEIAVTTAKYEAINVRKDIFTAGVDKVVIIGKDRKVVSAVQKKIRAAFSDDILSRVSVSILSEFIAEYS